MVNDILILTSGKVSKLEGFPENVDKKSFDDLSWDDAGLKVSGEELAKYKLIYFRLVGRSLEVAALVANYAKAHGIKIIDRLYEEDLAYPTSLSKLSELVKLKDAGVPIPITTFNKPLTFPYVLKSTSGKKGREAWLIRDEVGDRDLREKLDTNKNYFYQEFIPNAKRIRTLVIGDAVVGGIIRETKWNKDETKETLNSIPQDLVDLSLAASKAVNVQICGVDILTNETGKYWVIEANAAPAWNLINKYCGVKVEDEITKYLQQQL